MELVDPRYPVCQVCSTRTAGDSSCGFSPKLQISLRLGSPSVEPDRRSVAVFETWTLDPGNCGGRDHCGCAADPPPLFVPAQQTAARGDARKGVSQRRH